MNAFGRTVPTYIGRIDGDLDFGGSRGAWGAGGGVGRLPAAVAASGFGVGGGWAAARSSCAPPPSPQSDPDASIIWRESAPAGEELCAQCVETRLNFRLAPNFDPCAASRHSIDVIRARRTRQQR
jgi:hypothetical protein